MYVHLNPKLGWLIVFLGLSCASPSQLPVFLGQKISRELTTVPISVELDCQNEASELVTIAGAELQDSTLLLLLEQPGCSEDWYRVCGDSIIDDSEPGQWGLTVLYNPSDKECERSKRVLRISSSLHTLIGISSTNVQSASLAVYVR